MPFIIAQNARQILEATVDHGRQLGRLVDQVLHLTTKNEALEAENKNLLATSKAANDRVIALECEIIHLEESNARNAPQRIATIETQITRLEGAHERIWEGYRHAIYCNARMESHVWKLEDLLGIPRSYNGNVKDESEEEDEEVKDEKMASDATTVGDDGQGVKMEEEEAVDEDNKNVQHQ